ncbi:hypothetical protein BHM03_00055521 [Ensete ventricosum]|nr:hypothetical protein BHM03_00055521 [Ensete ventricosum]
MAQSIAHRRQLHQVRPHAEAATCSKGRARVCHKRLTATAVAAAARASGHRMQQRPSRATGGSPRLPTVSYQRPTAHRPLRRSQPHASGCTGGGDGSREGYGLGFS